MSVTDLEHHELKQAYERVLDRLAAKQEECAQAIRDAVREEREANCKAVCWMCRQGYPFQNGHHETPEAPGVLHACNAAFIRNRGDAEK